MSTRRSADELRAIAHAAATELADADADAIAAWAATEFPGTLAVACSMASDTVLPALVSMHAPGVDVLFLDTGYHFPQTLATRDKFAAEWDVNVVELKPTLSVAEQDAEHGPRLYERDPAACCGMRKVAPLDDALAGYEAWVTGVRREENALRANAQPVEWDERHQMVKINPVVAWTFDELLDWATRNIVTVNPLLADGYPSIGCEPCTKRVAPGEDPRSGRWAGLSKTECGIHL